MTTIKQLIFHLGHLKEGKIREPELEGRRALIAVKLGWNLTGGFGALQLYTAKPPCMMQMDYQYITHRVRAWAKFLQLGASFTKECEERLVRHVRDVLHNKVLSRPA